MDKEGILLPQELIGLFFAVCQLPNKVMHDCG